MRTIIKYLAPYKKGMLIGLAIKITGTFADLGLPWVLAYILDDVIPHGKLSYILIWGLIMLLLAVAARELNIQANRMASKVARDTTQLMRHDCFERICHLSGAQVDAFTVPSLISRMTSDSYNIHRMIGMMQRFGVRAPIVLTGGIILTTTLDPVLTLVLVGTLPLLAIVIYIVSKHGIPLFTIVQTSVDKMVLVIRENISGIRVIKALSKTEYEKQRFSNVNEEVSGNEIKAGSIMAMSGPIMNLLLNVGLAVVIIVGAYRVNAGHTEPGKIIAFLSYFTMILNTMMMVNRLFVNYSKASASADRIEEVLLTKQDLIVEKSEVNVDTMLKQGKNVDSFIKTAECTIMQDSAESNSAMYNNEFISFDHVSFGYVKASEKYCLKDINFSIKRGESLGIIGSTGSGKTTIINLLMRFYDPSKGTIKIGQKDIKTIPLKELRQLFGTVFQNDVIFADTIEENISFGRDLTTEQVELAAAQACAKDFIMEKEDGFFYEAAIKGANLSGGQKQRILIARALADHPMILVLDDSSSALDYKTDANLRNTIRNDFKDTTIVMVAQRVSSIMQLDHILVLEEGEMIGYGSHEELLAQCSVYKEIYDSQMGSAI